MKILSILTMLMTASLAFSASLLGGETDGRAVAMGEATVATQTGPMTVWSNPAGLISEFSGSAFIGMHRGIGDVKGSHLAGSYKKKQWALGVIARSAQSEDLERRDLPTFNPQGTFGVRESNFGFGIARSLSPKLSAGYSAIYRYDRIEDNVATEWRHSLGFQYQWSPLLRSGFALQQVLLTENLDDGIAILRAGAEYRKELPMGSEVTGAADLQMYKAKMRTGVGLEWTILHVLSLRGGYRFGFDSQGLTYGIGAKWNHFTFDMGMTPFENDLGTNLKVSIRIDG